MARHLPVPSLFKKNHCYRAVLLWYDGFLVPATAKSITENIEPILKTIKDFVFKEYFLALARKYWMMTKYNGRMSKHAMSSKNPSLPPTRSIYYSFSVICSLCYSAL